MSKPQKSNRRHFLKQGVCTAGAAITLPSFISGHGFADDFRGQKRSEINFPNIPGYQTLACDFHMHTLYSDGRVMPEVRVEEAYRTGLDAIAITDHIEWRPSPFKKKLPGASSHNTGADLAIAGAKKQEEVVVIKGTEVTRDVPNVPSEVYKGRFDGHYIALFLKDANALDINANPKYAKSTEEEKILVAAEKAAKQNAFFAWAHHNLSDEPEWVSKVDNWTSMQDTMIEKGYLHGLEVANNNSYYPLAHQWCLDKGLTMLGNSDIHYPENRQAQTNDNHRSITLVFAKEATQASIQEALKAGRTVVWLKKMLIGNEKNLKPLFDASVKFDPIHKRTDSQACLKVHNVGPVEIKLTRTGKVGPESVTLPPQSVTLFELTMPKEKKETQLTYTVDNFLIAPETGLPISIKLLHEKRVDIYRFRN